MEAHDAPAVVRGVEALDERAEVGFAARVEIGDLVAALAHDSMAFPVLPAAEAGVGFPLPLLGRTVALHEARGAELRAEASLVGEVALVPPVAAELHLVEE